MVYIYDNGEDYSDHSISFIECDYEPTEHVVNLINAAHQGRGDGGGCVATAPSLEWRDESANTPLHVWCGPMKFFSWKRSERDDVGCDDPTPRFVMVHRNKWFLNEAMLRTTPRPLLDYLLERWPSTNHRDHSQPALVEAIVAALGGERETGGGDG